MIWIWIFGLSFNFKIILIELVVDFCCKKIFDNIENIIIYIKICIKFSYFVLMIFIELEENCGFCL